MLGLVLVFGFGLGLGLGLGTSTFSRLSVSFRLAWLYSPSYFSRSALAGGSFCFALSTVAAEPSARLLALSTLLPSASSSVVRF